MPLQLSTLQDERNVWIEKNFPNDRIEDSIFGAVEEMGEIAHHFLKMTQGIRGDEEMHRYEILDGVADAVIFLAGIPSHLDADYGLLVQETWLRVKHRDWIDDPQKGGE